MTELQDTAILLFSRSANREAHIKKWTQEPELNYRIASHLVRRTKGQLAQSTLPIFHIDESRQTGKSFGEKLSNAFQDVFEKGFHFVICVGNDCQNLRLQWTEIAKTLRSNKAVLGPDQRGGVYLIGISAEMPFKRLFQRIPWNTPHVFEALSEHFHDADILETKRDTNTFEDIRTDKELFTIFKTFKVKNLYQAQHTSIIPSLLIQQKPLRAPPFLN